MSNLAEPLEMLMRKVNLYYAVQTGVISHAQFFKLWKELTGVEVLESFEVFMESFKEVYKRPAA